VLDVRVYRAAFLPALVALFVAAFSLADRPAPASSPLAADAFSSDRAFGSETAPPRDSLLELGRSFPDRRPGSAGDLALAGRVAAAFSRRDPDTHRPVFTVSRTRTPGGGRDLGDLETVVGVRPGLSNHRVVVVADRSAPASAGRPALADLSATATLLELARAVRARDLRKTLVLVSTSGAGTGYAGARAWAEAAAGSGPIDGVIVLGDVASRRVTRPWVVPWSTGSEPAPIGLQRTVEAAVRREVGRGPGNSRAVVQWIRRALPATVSEQGVIGGAGLPAVLLSASGERGPAPNAAVSRGQMDAFGRAALRAVSALDAARGGDGDSGAFSGGPEGIVTLHNVLPDWAVRGLVGTLLLPALLTALDGFFRARRRRLPVGPWLGWLAWAGAPLLAAWLWVRLLGLTGAMHAPPALVPPGAVPIGAGDAVALLSVPAVAALAWLALRPLVRASRALRGSPAAGGLAGAAGLVITVAATLAWLYDPYLAALLLPAAHLWLFAAAPGSRARGAWGAAMLVGGLALPAVAVLVDALVFSSGPLGLAWLLMLGTAAGHVTAPTLLVTAGFLAALAGLVRILMVRRRLEADAPQDPIRTRGPLSYAGPGSLGGTESALRR
jgi:hypothetical protein